MDQATYCSREAGEPDKALNSSLYIVYFPIGWRTFEFHVQPLFNVNGISFVSVIQNFNTILNFNSSQKHSSSGLETVEMATRDVINHLLFEVSTEVYEASFFPCQVIVAYLNCRANRIGGIYSVLKSKAPVTSAEYRERYMLIGPLSYKSAPG